MKLTTDIACLHCGKNLKISDLKITEFYLEFKLECHNFSYPVEAKFYKGFNFEDIMELANIGFKADMEPVLVTDETIEAYIHVD